MHVRGERNVAGMHSVMDSGASKCMDAMRFGIFMQMNDHQYKSGVWNYLSLIIGPVNPGSLRCQCGTLMSDPDYPTHMCTPQRSKNRTARYKTRTYGTEECSAQACL